MSMLMVERFVNVFAGIVYAVPSQKFHIQQNVLDVVLHKSWLVNTDLISKSVCRSKQPRG